MDGDAPGCLTIPLLIIIVPVRLLWEVLSAAGRLIRDYVMRPIGWLLYNGLLRPLAWVLRVFVLVPVWWVLRLLVFVPLRWLYLNLVVPVGRLVFRYVLRPLWAAFAWTVAVIAIPFVFLARWLGRGLATLWRVVLWPALAALGRLVAEAWHLAGIVLFHALVRPVRLLWRVLVTPVLRGIAYAWRVTVVPVARWMRAHVWEPACATARSINRALGLAARRP